MSMIALGISSNPYDNYPFPYPNGISPCEDTTNPPEILSFHVHVVFDGSNKTTAQSALNLHSSFISATNPNMEICPFSHPNGASFYDDICVFPFNQTALDWKSVIFGNTDYAFFIPKQHYLYADMWFRQNYNPNLVSYMFHVNTGCEDWDHTVWSMVNEGYPYKTNKSGLFCCHDGPNNCYCDITQYILNNKCINANYKTNSLYLSQCSSKGMDSSGWRETYYNQSFIQLENFGTTGTNTYMCLGQSDENDTCSVGKQLSLIPCKQNDEAKVLFNYDQNMKRLKALNCGNEKNSLCVSYENDLFVLNECNSSTQFIRNWIKN